MIKNSNRKEVKDHDYFFSSFDGQSEECIQQTGGGLVSCSS